MNRRQFLLASIASGAGWLLQPAQVFAEGESLSLPLWPGGPPGGGGPGGPPLLTPRGALSHIAQPSLTFYQPQKPNGRAVLVAAGGGYKRIEMAKEAMPATQWLLTRGFRVYVLSYRLPAEGWLAGNAVALQDALQALHLVGRREQRFSLLGFSAGAHLLGLAVTAPEMATYPQQDDRCAKPQGIALIYPIISLEAPYNHTSTHHILLGRNASAGENARWSVQNHVSASTPPVFLAQAEDDPIADPHNSLLMANACQQANVPVELHLYRTGGHGFAMGRRGTPTMQWPEAYLGWLGGLG